MGNFPVFSRRWVSGSAALVEMYLGLALAAPRRSVARSTVGAGDRLSRVPVTDSETHCRLIATKQTNYTFWHKQSRILIKTILKTLLQLFQDGSTVKQFAI